MIRHSPIHACKMWEHSITLGRCAADWIEHATRARRLRAEGNSCRGKTVSRTYPSRADGAGAESETSLRGLPLYKLADNRPSALGEHSERNAKPTFILCAMGDRILCGRPLNDLAEGHLGQRKACKEFLGQMRVTCANPEDFHTFLHKFHIRCPE
jgi:hypothetical protein